jgi:hypothetical protein
VDASSAILPEAFSTGRDTVTEYDPETDAPFMKSPAPSKNDQLDVAGQTILGLLHKAASAAEAKSQACHRNGTEAVRTAWCRRK